MYIYEKSACTEGFTGMIHGLAILAALTNAWPMSFIPTCQPLLTIMVDGRVVATVSPENSPELFAAFNYWRRSPMRTSAEYHAWESVLDVATEYLRSIDMDEDADSVEIIET